MATDVLQYLTEKGLAPKRASSVEFHVACPWCGENPEKRGRLYVNVNPDADILGLHHCKLCDHRGSLVTMQKFFGDVTEQQEKEDSGYKRRAILAAAASFYSQNLTDNPDVVDWLTDDRGLTAKTIKDHQLGYASGGLFKHLRVLGYDIQDIQSTGLITTERGTGRTVDFFTNHVTIPYHTNGSVVMIRGRDRGIEVDPGRKYLTGPGQKTRLFNTDVTWGADEICITEGEFDALILEQYGFKAVGVPGAGIWQDTWDAYFEECRRVWVIFDRDERETGQKGARKVIDHLGTKARRVELPPHELGKAKNDITEFFVVQHKTAADFIALVRASSQYLLTVVDAVREFNELQGKQGVKFNLAMDLQLHPGLLPSQLLVYLAKTGCVAGDTIIRLNRGGKGFGMKISDVVDRWDGRRYAWDKTIPTYVQREVDGRIVLAPMQNAWCSGEKQTFTVTTATGRTIRATDEHPFLTERGWLRLDRLVPGDLLHVSGSQASGQPRKKKAHYHYRSALRHHPYANRRNVKNGGWSVPLHRLVAEADINGMKVSDFLTCCRLGPTESLTFLDPEEWTVHHVDENPHNNDLSNLKVVTPSEHHRIHADLGAADHLTIKGELDEVVSVVPYGWEMTYDIEVADDPHNFVANGFIVHNTGKTIWLLNLFQRICMLDDKAKILFVSLEQTRGDWWDRARRIYRFFNLGSTDAEAAAWWTNRIWIDDRNRVSPDDLYELVEDFQYQTGQMPTIVAVDYLGYWAQTFKGERYERTSDAVMTLKAIAKDLLVPIIAPHQVNRMTMHGTEPSIEAARDSGVVEETADFVMALWSEDTTANRKQEDHTGAFNIKVAKSRHGGVGYVENFFFAPLTLAIVPASDQLRCGRATNELLFRHRYAESWEQALVRHETGLDPQIADYTRKILPAHAAKLSRLTREEAQARQGTIL